MESVSSANSSPNSSTWSKFRYMQLPSPVTNCCLTADGVLILDFIRIKTAIPTILLRFRTLTPLTDMSSSSSGLRGENSRSDQIEFVSTLKKNRFASTILLRITALWLAAPAGKQETEGDLEAIGVDSKGDGIHIVFDKSQTSLCKDLLEEGKIYSFSNIPVVPPATSYRPVNKEYRLRVNGGTSVVEETDSSTHFQRYFFDFLDFLEVPTRLDSKIVLTDVIGLITKIQDPMEGDTGFGTATFSKLYIEDLSGNELAVTLWGNLNKEFRQRNLLTSTNSVFVVSSIIIKKFGAEYYGQSTKGSKFFINLDIPEVQQYLSRFAKMPKEPEQVQKAASRPRQEIPTKTIDELLAGPNENVMVGKQYYCQAKVTGFDVDGGWYYTGCKICKKSLKKVTDLAGITRTECTNCGLTNPESLPLYKLETVVADESGTTVFTVFGISGEKFLGAKVTLLVNTEGMDPQAVHPIMEKVVGKTKMFQVILKDNRRDGYNILVQNIFNDNALPQGSQTPSQSPTITNCELFGGSSSSGSVASRNVKNKRFCFSHSVGDDHHKSPIHIPEKIELPNLGLSKESLLRNFENKQSLSTESPTVTNCTLYGGSSSGSSYTPREVEKSKSSDLQPKFHDFQNPTLQKLEEDILPGIDPAKQALLRNLLTSLIQEPALPVPIPLGLNSSTQTAGNNEGHYDISATPILKQAASDAEILTGTVDAIGAALQVKTPLTLVQSEGVLTDGLNQQDAKIEEPMDVCIKKLKAPAVQDDDVPLSQIFVKKRQTRKGKQFNNTLHLQTQGGTKTAKSTNESAAQLSKLPKSRKSLTKTSTDKEKASKRPKKGSA